MRRPVALKPPALKEGDTLGLAAPASPLDRARIEAAATRLRERGYKVRIGTAATKKLGFLAGSDADRVSDLHELFLDPTVRAIVCVRGGYGSPRLLDLLDMDVIRKHPKILVGYSDITALHLALQKETGLVVFHGPMAKEWSAPRGLSPFAESHYWEAFQPQSRRFARWGVGVAKPRKLVAGIAEGRLVGGNLSVICALMGTRYEIDTTDAILFLEDVGEKLFRIDRMLNQLRLGGKLAQAKGILFGRFAACEDRDGQITLDEIFKDYCGDLGVPVLADFPAGHVADHATLPLGVQVRLDATAGNISILESPVTPR